MNNNRLKEARVLSGKSQLDAAKILSTTQMQISKYETGKQDITFSRLILLADFYDVSIDWIAGLSDDQNIRRKEAKSE